MTALRGCLEDPTESFLDTVLSSGEVLPFNDALGLRIQTLQDQAKQALARRA